MAVVFNTLQYHYRSGLDTIHVFFELNVLRNFRVKHNLLRGTRSMCFLCIQKHVKTYNNFLTVVRQTNFGQIVNHINPNNFLPSTGIQKVVVDHFTITAQLRRYRPWGGGQVSIPSKRYKICTIRHRTYTDGFRITDYGKLRHPVHQHHRKLFIP